MPRKSNTRSAQGDGTIRHRSDGRWEARYTVGRDPGTGKQIQKSVYGATQDEVRRKLKGITKDIDDGTYTAPSKMKLGQWLDIWVEEYLGDVKPSTAHLYSEDVRLYLKPALGAVTLESLDAHTVQKVYNRLNKQLASKTVKSIHGVLHKSLQQAVEIGYIRVNPTAACKLPKSEHKEIKPLDEQQQTDFIAAIQGHTHELLYKIDMFTGLREGELLGLTWDCVDFKKGKITVKQQLRREQKEGGIYYMSSPKNGKVRTITPAPSVMKLLKDQQFKQLEQRFKAGDTWSEKVMLLTSPMDTERGYNLVFRNETGGVLSYRTVYDCFKRVVDKIGVPEARFHDLRHPYVKPATTKKSSNRKEIVSKIWNTVE